MTISLWLVYLASVAEGVKAYCWFTGVIFVVLSAIIFFCATHRWESRISKSFLIAGLIAGFLCVSIPNQKSIAAMIVIPAVVNNQRIQGITGNGLEILNRLTLDWLNELKSKKEDEGI